MVPCKITAKVVSFERSHHSISSTESKVRIHYMSSTDSGSQGVKNVHMYRPANNSQSLDKCPANIAFWLVKA